MASTMEEKSILSGTRIFGMWKRKQKIHNADYRAKQHNGRVHHILISVIRIPFKDEPPNQITDRSYGIEDNKA